MVSDPSVSSGWSARPPSKSRPDGHLMRHLPTGSSPPARIPTWGRGFMLIPEPDDGDVFLDFEGHPFWRADCGLFFLLGLILRESDGEWGYRAYWAHDLVAEGVATQSLIDFLVARRAAHPGMHVYHYNHTERSALERLAADHGVAEVKLTELVETGLFVDLLVVARTALQVGTESYGLKHVERLTTFERGHEIDQGAGAVVEYDGFTKTQDPASLVRIAAYNEDDVRATRALRDWLVEHKPDDIDWRAAWLEPDEGVPQLDAQVTQLHTFRDGYCRASARRRPRLLEAGMAGLRRPDHRPVSGRSQHALRRARRACRTRSRRFGRAHRPAWNADHARR